MTGWGTARLTKELLDLAPKLKIIAHSAGSIKGLVSDEVWERKIKVTSAASAIAFSVAEFTLAYMILGLRQTIPGREQVKKGKWKLEEGSPVLKSLYGQTIGLIGAGFVGKQVVQTLKPFGANILIADPYLKASEAKTLGVTKVSLDQLAKRSDVVSLHAPNLPATHHIVGKSFLSKMKPHAVLVNTARGSLIDEAALLEKLKDNNLFVMLDVFEGEPGMPNDPLRNHPNVFLSPHIAGAGSYHRQTDFCITELERVLSGKKPIYEVTKEKLKVMA
jgi:phosphoglycerate dehydrogenase-like enzyme